MTTPNTTEQLARVFSLLLQEEIGDIFSGYVNRRPDLLKKDLGYYTLIKKAFIGVMGYPADFSKPEDVELIEKAKSLAEVNRYYIHLFN